MSTAPQRNDRPPLSGTSRDARRLLTVSAITALVKDAIAECLPGTVHVVGEISNFKRHSSGHLYFTLKDDASELGCVMWRSAASRLPFEPEDGMEIIATGYVDVFERSGRYQLYARKLEPRGVGTLELAFRQLREKLAAEGLFDPAHKQPLPPYPQRVAVVTSPTGAAVRDICQTLERRFATATVLLCPVAVQGPSAAGQIAATIRELNARRAELAVDVMIVGRGGGSLEDLWAFNEEVVARAIFASGIPVVSAVGHEVDVTIADLVADVRAATPTAAAELAVPDADELLAVLDNYASLLQRSARHQADLARLGLTGILQRRAFSDPLTIVQRREQAVDEAAGRLERLCRDRAHEAAARLRACEQQVARIAPQVYVLHLERALATARDRLNWAVTQRLAGSQKRWAADTALLERSSPHHRLERCGESLAHLERRLSTAVRDRQAHLAGLLGAQAGRLSALSYRSTLRRGFSITRLKQGRCVIRTTTDVTDGTRILTETADGEFESEVRNVTQMELFE